MTEEVIPINSTSDLLAALRHPDAARRHAVCDAIAAAPEAVLAYPPLDGRDVLDELVATLAELRPGSGEWLARFTALAAFDDPRARSVALATLAAGHDALSLLLAAERLEREPAAWRQDALAEPLLDARPLVARAAVRLLADAAGDRLPIAGQLRLALLDRARTAEPPVGNWAEPWLAELAGPLAGEAQAAAESLGEPAAVALLALWPRLDEATRRWLLPWAARVAPDQARPLVLSSLAADSPCLGAALRAAAELSVPTPELEPLLTDARAEVRLAAARLMPTGSWSARLADEPDPEVRAALAARLDTVEALVAALGDGDWRVRSAAAQALVAHGEAGRGAARTVFIERAASDPARCAAAWALTALGDDAWLSQQVGP